MSTTIKGKVVLLTGASSGIGREAAKMFAREGAFLAIAARRVARLEEVARDVEQTSGVPPLVLPADLSRPQDPDSLIKKIYDHYGRIDLLINNAAVLRMEPAADRPLPDMRTLMDINFWSIVRLTQLVVPIMRKQGGGHIINVASGVSRRGLPFMADYTASKWALAGFTESIRLELAAAKITFTSIYYGGVETEMPKNVDRSKLPANYPDHSRKRISVQRAARAILRAALCRPLEIYCPWYIRQAAWLSVLWPSAADFLIRRAQRMK